MPTEKPRVTFAISQDRLNKIDAYRFDNKFKNQTQAILSLIEKGLADFIPSESPRYSKTAMDLARKYDSLDLYGQNLVKLVVDAEVSRCEAQHKSDPSIFDSDIDQQTEEFRRRLLLEKKQWETQSPSSEDAEKMA